MRTRSFLSLALTILATSASLSAKEAGKTAQGRMKDDCYYEFRGRLNDRDTVSRRFTVLWEGGSESIEVNSQTKIYRRGAITSLESMKSGDVVCGFGQARHGRLVALAVAAGDKTVELPEKAKPAGVNTLRLAPITYGRTR